MPHHAPPLPRRLRDRVPVALAALRLLFVGAAGLSSAAHAGPGTLDPATIKEQVLPNGLRVIARESHAANLVSLQYWIRAGVFREDESTAGTAHVLEHLLFKGTNTRAQGNIDAEIEDLGGVLEAETDKDWTMLQVTVATPFWSKALTVLADTVQNPSLRVEDLEAERQVVLAEIRAAQVEPPRVLVNTLFQIAFSDHPYRFRTTGTEEQVLRIKIGPVRNYFREYYTPANSVLVVVGDVAPDAVFQQARALFKASGNDRRPTARRGAPRVTEGTDSPPAALEPPASLEPRRRGKDRADPSDRSDRSDHNAFFRSSPRPRGSSEAGVEILPIAVLAPPAGEKPPHREVLLREFRGGYYGVAFPAPGVRQVPDVYAMDVLVTMLEEGPTGRLPARLREQARLAVADYQTLREPGLLTVLVSTTPDRLESVEKAVLEEIARLRAAPPPAAEVEATKRLLSGAYALDNETFAGQGKSLGYYAAIDRWQFATSYLEKIGLVTPEQVQAAAVKYLVPERSATVILKPRGGEKE